MSEEQNIDYIKNQNGQLYFVKERLKKGIITDSDKLVLLYLIEEQEIRNNRRF